MGNIYKGSFRHKDTHSQNASAQAQDEKAGSTQPSPRMAPAHSSKIHS